MIANFFWRGNDFQFLNRLAVLSHLVVGHEVRMWVSGEVPKSRYWIRDIKEIEVRNANEVLDVAGFLRRGGNLRTASDMWEFAFLYQHGGLYCDTDIIALKHFPDSEWIISREKILKKDSLDFCLWESHVSAFLFC